MIFRYPKLPSSQRPPSTHPTLLIFTRVVPLRPEPHPRQPCLAIRVLMKEPRNTRPLAFTHQRERPKMPYVAASLPGYPSAGMGAWFDSKTNQADILDWGEEKTTKLPTETLQIWQGTGALPLQTDRPQRSHVTVNITRRPKYIFAHGPVEGRSFVVNLGDLHAGATAADLKGLLPRHVHGHTNGRLLHGQHGQDHPGRPTRPACRPRSSGWSSHVGTTTRRDGNGGI